MQIKKHYILLSLLFVILFSTGLVARPAPGQAVFQQPDGSRFPGVMCGDEFFHYAATEEGRLIVQDGEGWWCYAVSDGDRLVPTSAVVGRSGSAVVPVLTEIPPSLREKGRENRLSRPGPVVKHARRSLTQPAVRTRADVAEEVPTHIRGLVILAAFKDVAFRSSSAHNDFSNLLNQERYSAGGAVGCAQDYFKSQFGDRLRFTFDVVGPVTLPQKQKYYGANGSDGQDVNPPQMIADACQQADSEVDFSQYDQDGDGAVDFVFVFYAGRNEADGGGDDAVWPHAWYVKQGAGLTVTLDGKTLDRYACSSELQTVSRTQISMTGIGTFCHEFSHTLGLVDLYDTDYGGSQNKDCALGCWKKTALMDGGNMNSKGNIPPYYNVIDRILLSDYFAGPQMLTEGKNVLVPLSKGGVPYFLPTDTEYEYFLFECRDNSSWDSDIGGTGLLVYHFDQSDNDAGVLEAPYNKQVTALERWYYNSVNANPDCQCACLVPADASLPTSVSYNQYISNGFVSNLPRVFFPEGATSFSSANGFVYRSGQPSEYALTDIRFEGSNIAFNLVRSEVPPVVIEKNCRLLKLQDCIILSWTLPAGTEVPTVVSWRSSDYNRMTQEVLPYAPGKYVIVMDKLLPLTTYTIEMNTRLNGVDGKKTVLKALTMKRTAGGDGSPYICLKDVARNEDGSFTEASAFPLRLFNALDALEVEWFFDGVAVSVDASGYFTPGKSGRLKAVVHYEDGSRISVHKNIVVR